MAVIITTMVLDMKVHGSNPGAGVPGLRRQLRQRWHFLAQPSYVHVTERINGMVLWANLFLLFWIVPFVICWMEFPISLLHQPRCGLVLVLCSISYILLERSIIRCNGPCSRLARAVGRDLKGMVSLSIYVRVGDRWPSHVPGLRLRLPWL